MYILRTLCAAATKVLNSEKFVNSMVNMVSMYCAFMHMSICVPEFFCLTEFTKNLSLSATIISAKVMYMWCYYFVFA